MSKLRCVAWVGRVSHTPRTRHTLHRGGGAAELMAAAQLVLIEAEFDGSAQIYRYALDGELAGDTWHQTLGEAEEQLMFEYGNALGPWTKVPQQVADAHAFVVEWGQRSRPEE